MVMTQHSVGNRKMKGFDEKDARFSIRPFAYSGMRKHEEELMSYLLAGLSCVPYLHILGDPPQRAGAVSFVADGVHPFDIAAMLEKRGIAVRIFFSGNKYYRYGTVYLPKGRSPGQKLERRDYHAEFSEKDTEQNLYREWRSDIQKHRRRMP